MYNGILFITAANAYGMPHKRVCLPPPFHKMALSRTHDHEVGHGAFRRTVERLKSWCWWSSCINDAYRYCKACRVCKVNKYHLEKPVPILSHPEVSRVFQRVHLDLVGPLPLTSQGHRYIMTCIDAFSRFAICVPLMNKTMSCVARNFVDHVICAYGPIESLYTDRGLEWVGSDFKEAVRNLGISQSFTCAFSPNSNGLVERYNKSIIEILRCLCYEQPSSWDSSLRLAMLAFNSSYCVPIHESPHYIFS